MNHIELTKAEHNIALCALQRYRCIHKRETSARAQKNALAAEILISKLREPPTTTIIIYCKYARIMKRAVGVYAMENKRLRSVVSTIERLIEKMPNKQGRWQKL